MPVPDAEPAEDLQSQVPDQAVEITLDAPNIMRKRKKGGFDMEAWFRRQINRYKKETQLDIHKVKNCYE